MVQSPCKNICTLNAFKVCTGCNRTQKEIATWTRLTDQEKQLVLDRINALLAQR